jgi:hypothetical protein
VRSVPGQSRDIAARARETTDDQKILVPADQGRHRVAPVAGIRHVGELRHIVAVQQIVEIVLPSPGPTPSSMRDAPSQLGWEYCD